ncbi:MAG: hypothetical protein OIN66_09120 [Candidatus Methanoperedens sp.]|nr:hypothetical protein [Candidatus Methanoperedens sp.]
MKWICLLAICLLVSAGIATAEEDLSSAQLVQFAVSKMGGSDQEAAVSGFDNADSKQIGYSSDGSVTQTISYENIGNGSVIQWGESGDMPRQVRTLSLGSVGDSGFIWQWNKGDVNQTMNIRNSDNLYLKQIIGGLRVRLFPDPQAQEPDMGEWWFCGKPINNTGGLPLCAQKIARKIMDGKASARDYYTLQVLEEDNYAFPPESLTPHIVLTKWNITNTNDNLTIKFHAYNYGKKTYNATLMMDLTPQINIVRLDGIADINAGSNQNWEIKVSDRQTTEIGNYTVPSLKGVDGEAVLPLSDMKIKNLQMMMVSE